MLSCGDSYNGIYKRQIFTNLNDCVKVMNDWLIFKCSQSYCKITQHRGFDEKQIISKKGENETENPWD